MMSHSSLPQELWV